MAALLDVFVNSIWCPIVLWRMHFGHTWLLLWAIIIICYIVFSRNLILALQCVLTSTTYQSLRHVSIVTHSQMHATCLIAAKSVKKFYSLRKE